MSLVASTANSPYRASGRRLSPFEAIRGGRSYLARHGLPTASDDVALEIGVTLALVGESPSLRDELSERLGGPRGQRKSEEKPESEPEPGRKRRWGHSRTARVEVRLTRQEQETLKARAATQGESVAEFVRGAVVGGEMPLWERKKRLAVRDDSNPTPSPQPRSADFGTQLEQAKETRERWRAGEPD